MVEPLPVIGDIRDLCSDEGFQWEFGCRRCRTAYRSPFDRNLAGQGRGLLRMAGQWFGGDLARASYTMDSYGNSYHSGPYDGAKGKHYTKALQAVLPKFRQCPDCSQWLCEPVCWNADSGRCLECSPRQRQTSANITRRCAACGNVGSGKFCQRCGQSMNVPVHCANCGVPAAAGAAFCGNCGNALK